MKYSKIKQRFKARVGGSTLIQDFVFCDSSFLFFFFFFFDNCLISYISLGEKVEIKMCYVHLVLAQSHSHCSSFFVIYSVKESCLLLTLKPGSAILLRDLLYQSIHGKGSMDIAPVSALHDMGVYRLSPRAAEIVLNLRTDWPKCQYFICKE